MIFVVDRATRFVAGVKVKLSARRNDFTESWKYASFIGLHADDIRHSTFERTHVSPLAEIASATL